MKPISFPQQNIVFTKDQPEYLPLPAFQYENNSYHCWQLSWRERFKVLFTGNLWISVMTFRNPPQPILPMVDSPFAL